MANHDIHLRELQISFDICPVTFDHHASAFPLLWPMHAACAVTHWLTTSCGQGAEWTYGRT